MEGCWDSRPGGDHGHGGMRGAGGICGGRIEGMGGAERMTGLS